MKHFRTTAIVALMLGAGTAHASSATQGGSETVAIPAQAVSVGAEIEVIRQGRASHLCVDRITLSDSKVTIEASDALGEPSLLEIEA